MAFQGSLTELPLPDIIQLVSVSGKTGKFTLTRGRDEGTIFLRNGQIVHAGIGALSGEEAVYALAIWNEGEFTFTPSDEEPEQTITRSNTNLLMEAARRADEWKVLSKKIPSVDLVPELVPRANRHEQITINPQEWLLVTKIDGHRSISDVAGMVELSAFEVAKTLYGMLTAELVTLKKRAEPSRPVPVPTPAPAPAPAPPPPAAKRDDGEVEALVDLATRIRKVAEQHIGAAGMKSIERQYAIAIEGIHKGGGTTAVRELIRELEKTTAVLKGAAVAEQLRGDIAALLRMAS